MKCSTILSITPLSRIIQKSYDKAAVISVLTLVGGAMDTIGFITLSGFFTVHVTGNLVLTEGRAAPEQATVAYHYQT